MDEEEKKRSSGCNGGKRSLSGAACHKQIRSETKIHPDNARTHKAAHQPTNRSQFDEWTEKKYTYTNLSTTTFTQFTHLYFTDSVLFSMLLFSLIALLSPFFSFSLSLSSLFFRFFFHLCSTFSIHIAWRRSCIRAIRMHSIQFIIKHYTCACACDGHSVGRWIHGTLAARKRKLPQMPLIERCA